MKISFESNFFEKRKIDKKAIDKYFNGAIRDFKIAADNHHPEVIFKFSYDSLIKTGLALVSSYGYRTKSRQGHHIKILEKLSQILDNKSIKIMGEAMRKKRNLDLYDGGTIISNKEAEEYLDFIRDVIKDAEKFLKSQKSLF
ncbi:hypothetical protein KKE19_04040 [Patescibacteria group bacterium]|nr:hypothetical protein [Patescibacteria group bacterium]MBU4274952.1 hypothetical protein [Patescibacteria group bacterium]MBU4367866.1 hypothetical protein [Patescibacteria group bacterium]MBU4461957.1 hypothetical protein [Patescibacteria group bacterium]MCG2699900.1 hypothetical protein [Candidatus Parcubacteria bacterium]